LVYGKSRLGKRDIALKRQLVESVVAIRELIVPDGVMVDLTGSTDTSQMVDLYGDFLEIVD
jgi:hypothetical protein